MPLPTGMQDLSTTAASNSPAGGDPVGTSLDNYLREIQAIVRHTNAKGADIASAATTNIAAATGEFVTVTGTATITALGTIDAGIVRVVHFSGSLTLTHNATSLILPGAQNYVTTAGDVLAFRSLGSGNWRCVGVTRASSGIPTPITVATVAAMKALTGLADGSTIDTLADSSFNDGGGEAWEYDSAATDTPSATIKQPDTGGGRFFMIRPNRGDVRRYGIKADGSTVDTTALNAALADTRIQWLDLGGRTIKLNSGLAAVTRSLVIENGTLDFSGVSGAFTGLQLGGSMGSSTSVTGPLTKGSTTSFTVASAAGFVIGGWCWVGSADAWASGVTKGEWARISNVSGTTITVSRPLRDSYSTTIVAYAPTMVKAPKFYGVRMIGPNAASGTGHTALKLSVIEGLEVDDLYCFGFEDRGLELTKSVDFHINNTRGESFSNTGLAYAVVVGNGVADGQITGTRGRDLRHAVTIGGEQGVDRDVCITDTIGKDMREATVDCHPGAENIIISGFTHESDLVTTGDGAIVQGLNCKLSNGTIRGSTRHGVVFQPLCSAYPSAVNICDVDVIDCTASATAAFQITNEVAQDIRSVTMDGCSSYNCYRGLYMEALSTGQAIRKIGLNGANFASCTGDSAALFLSRSGKTIRDISISGGTYEVNATSAGNYVIYFNAAAANGVRDATVSGAAMVGGQYNIRGVNSVNHVIVGNRGRGFGTGFITGITHDGTNEIVTDNVTV